jgi:hypothetical protein
MSLLKKENRYALIVLGLMIVLGSALAFVSLYLIPQARGGLVFVGSGGNNELLHVPRVFSSVTSEDGAEHTITVDFTLAVDESARGSVNVNSVHSIITSTIEGLRHDMINAPGGVDYLKTEVIRELNHHIDPDDLRGLFIRNISRDDNLAVRALETLSRAAVPDEAVPPEQDGNLREFFGGLGWR